MHYTEYTKGIGTQRLAAVNAINWLTCELDFMIIDQEIELDGLFNNHPHTLLEYRMGIIEDISKLVETNISKYPKYTVIVNHSGGGIFTYRNKTFKVEGEGGGIYITRTN